MKVPFLNFEREMDFLIKNGIMNDIEKVMRSGRFLFGPKTAELESQLSELFNKPAVLVGSGTDALFLSLKALGIKSGDYVAIPAFSAIPTAVSVHMIGAIPIYIDVDTYFTMNPKELEKAVENFNIKAVIPVHLYGNPAEIGKIRSICQNKNIILIEDCAQSFGAKSLSDSFLGTLGMAGAFSFYPTKNFGSCGDGGCIIACDENLAQLIRELRFYGQKSNYKMGENIGINSRMDEIQCSILLHKLKYLPKLLERRLEMKSLYDEAFSEKSWISPVWRRGALPHIYPIIVYNRNDVVKLLLDRGVETAVHYPFHLGEEVERKPGIGEFSMAKRFSQRVLSIPFNPWMTDKEISYVLQSVKEVIV